MKSMYKNGRNDLNYDDYLYNMNRIVSKFSNYDL